MPDSVKIVRRYHLHPPGILYIAITVMLGVGAINSQNNLLFVVFGVALSAMVFSGLMSGAMLMGVSVERRHAEGVGAGQPLRFTYAVHNRNRFVPAFALTITEQRPARGRPARQCWTRLLSAPSAFVAQVGPRSTVRAHAQAETTRRGVATLEGIVVSSSFPFGVFRKSMRFCRPDQVVVFPGARPLSPGVFHALYARARLGDHSAAKRGRGDEFYGLRDYARGDSPRYIAWKASARSGNLVTRLTTDQATSFMRILLLLDARDSSVATADPAHDPNELAIILAASIIEEAYVRSMHVGLAVPQAGVRLEPGSSQRHRRSLLRALAMIDAGSLSDETDGERPLGGAGPTLVIAPDGRRHRLAPQDVPALDVDALSRWGLDPTTSSRRAPSAEPSTRGAA